MDNKTIKKIIELNNSLYEKQFLSWHKTRISLWEKPVINFLKKIKDNSSLLDLGCGNARLYQYLTKKPNFKKINLTYLGVDKSKRIIKLNKTNYPLGNFEIIDALKMNYKNKFNYIISLALLHHIPSEKLQIIFLKKCYTALKKEGILFISVWNRWNLKYQKFSNQKKQFLDMNKNDYIVPWKNTQESRFIHAFTKTELIRITQKTNFKNIKVFYADRNDITNKKNGLNIYLVCTK